MIPVIIPNSQNQIKQNKISLLGGQPLHTYVYLQIQVRGFMINSLSPAEGLDVLKSNSKQQFCGHICLTICEIVLELLLII